MFLKSFRQYANAHPTPLLRIPRRISLFLLAFLPLFAISQILIFMQPAIYRSEASVLTSESAQVDQPPAEADPQQTGIQTQVLLGQDILDKTAARLSERSAPVDVADLHKMLGATPVADSNLIKLHAEGNDPGKLQVVLNAWIDTYRQIRADYIRQVTAQSTATLDGELDRVAVLLAAKRRELDQFRLTHNILSQESSDNQAHARLQGLNASLNSALEEEAKAKAKVEAIRAAIEEGRPVIPNEDSRSLAVLQENAERLRDRLESLRGQYTEQYIDFHPTMKVVKQQLSELDAKISEKERSGTDFMLQEANTAYVAARRTVVDLQKQLAQHKQKAAEYTGQFEKYQAMRQELEGLEKLQQDTKQRLADIEVKQRQTHPQLSVIDWATLPTEPVRPDYWLAAAIALAASVGAGLFAVWLADYLNPNPPLRNLQTITGIRVYPHRPSPNDRRQLLDRRRPPDALGFDPLQAINEAPREDSEDRRRDRR